MILSVDKLKRTGWKPKHGSAETIGLAVREMLGGEFAAHPWIQFWAPVIIEDWSFPAMRHFPASRMMIYDEMYVPRSDTWSRSIACAADWSGAEAASSCPRSWC
jgi:hypothetical protein